MSKTKKVLNIVVNILVYAFLALAVVSLVFVMFSKNDAVTVFGRQVYIVVSGSMEKCENTDVSDFEIKDIPVKSAVFIECVPKDAAQADEWYSDLQVGDVLTFKYLYTTQETVTHRIVEIEENGDGGYTIQLEGDNKGEGVTLARQTIRTEEVDSPNYVIGKVTSVSYPLGVVIHSLTQPLGIAFLVMIPCFAIILLEVIRIVKYLGEEKRKKAEASSLEKDDEIEQLRAQIEALKEKVGDNAQNTVNNAENDGENEDKVTDEPTAES